MSYSANILTGILVLALGAAVCAPAWSADKPNIVLIYTDDLGWADLGANGVSDDVLTPHLDALAANGVRFTNGLVTSPLCAPSRAGLLTGKYQERFGFEWNIHGPLPLDQTTIAEQISDQGYATGMVGKWHLAPRSADQEWIDANLGGDWSSVTEQDLVPYRSYNRGFTDAFEGDMTNVRATFDLAGNTLAQPTNLHFPGAYRIDLQTQAALSFIDRHADEPFFLYLPYFAPHVPLEAPQEYLDRFPGDMPERRRYALAMIAAVDDGVGQIMGKLEQHGLTQDTLVMFISDNGAPLALDMPDEPIEQNVNVWNGSLNTPFVGEKATLMEGGIRVPYIASLPGTLPQGVIYDQPVLQIDAAATAVALAGGDISSFDGKNLIPHLTGQTAEAPHDLLYWRFGAQEAVRQGDWKLLRLANYGVKQVWLFDMSVAEPERVNLAGEHPLVVERLSGFLDNWVTTLARPPFPASYPAGVIQHNHFLPTPVTGVTPNIVVDLGYDQVTGTNEMVVDLGTFQRAVFGGVRMGGGITADFRTGASISNSTPGGGGLSFVSWDLPNGDSAQQQAIATDHHIEFDLTLDGSEVLAIEGVQISGVSDSASTNFFSLFASDDGFATAPVPGHQLDNTILGPANNALAFGDLDDPENPVRNYLPFDFIPTSPLPVGEQGTTWTFRLYINEDGISDLNAFIIDSIAFGIQERVPVQGDTDGDGVADASDNCIEAPNGPLASDDLSGIIQRDTDGDGYGNYCDPDFNNDGIVNSADLAYFKPLFFTGDADADLNGDGLVNAGDLAILRQFFFEPPGPSGLRP